MRKEPNHIICNIHGLPVKKLDPFGNLYCSECYSNTSRHPTLQALIHLIKEWSNNPNPNNHIYRIVKTTSPLSHRDTDLAYPQFRRCSKFSDCERCSPQCEVIGRLDALAVVRGIRSVEEVIDLLNSFGFSNPEATDIIYKDDPALRRKLEEKLRSSIRDTESTHIIIGAPETTRSS